MEVYIEYVLIDNLVINSIILLLSLKMLKLSVINWRVVLGASVGTIVAILLPLISLQGVGLIAFKLALGMLICVCALDKFDIKHLMRFYICFLMFTFVMGGVCYGIIYSLTGSASLTDYALDIPVGVILIVVVVWARYLQKLINLIHKRNKLTLYLYELDLVLRKKKYKINAYFDTGNLMVDRDTKKPIVIISLAKVIDEFDINEVMGILSGNIESVMLEDAHIEEFKAMSVSGKMVVFKPKMFNVIETKTDLSEKVLVALSIKPLTKEGKFDALIGPKVLSGGV